MPRPFNFYQGTGFGTGPYAPTNYVDFFTGFYFPLDTSLGQGVGFLWPASDVEIPYTLTVSGSPVDSNKQIVSLGVGIYGFISPLLRESGTLGVSIISGAPTQDNIDRVPFTLSIRGQNSGDNVDRPNFYFLIKSGAQISGNKDTTSMGLTYTGETISGSRDNVSYGLRFWGQFTPPDSDTASLMMRMYDVAYVDTNSYTTKSGYTGIRTSFNLINVIYDDAV
jgi:hypothetical protein